MKNLIKYSACTLFSLLSACGAPCIDEHYAAMVVKDALSLPGAVTAQKLTGGKSSEVQLFVATANSKKYVVRIIKRNPPEDREDEIYNSRVAADEGYGPQIYYANHSQGIVIMEYLSGQKVTYQDLQSDQTYITLARLLQKIHHGKALSGREYNGYKRVSDAIRTHKPKYNDYVPLTRVEQVLSICYQALLPHLTKTSCHNDLHGGNWIFLGNEYKAIDYEDAGPNDPYFDVANAAIEVDVATMALEASAYNKPAHKINFLALYLNCQPSAAEEAKLYLMKQIVLLRLALDDLNRLADSEHSEHIYQYKSFRVPSIKDFAKDRFEGKFNLPEPENGLTLLKTRFNQVIENSESQEFKDAVKTLNKQAARTKA
jgi:thiamine kinase-like enzyme